jgi:hypothetical protein
MPNDDATNTDEYHPIGSGTSYQIHPPTNAKIKELVQIELRAVTGGGLQQKKQRARTFGWDPANVIPGYERTETVEEGGEEVEVTRANDLEMLSFPAHMREAAEVLFIGLDFDEEGLGEDQLRIDEVQRAIADFTSRVFGTNGGLMTS